MGTMLSDALMIEITHKGQVLLSAIVFWDEFVGRRRR